MIGASEDGSYVYYVADGALTENAGRGFCGPRVRQEQKEEQQGLLPVSSCTLYVDHAVGETGHASWETRAIAVLSTQDIADWQPTPAAGELASVTARVSPNGLYLAFMSNSSLTGYDNVEANPKAGGARAEEAYRYAYQQNALVCASCDPGGSRPGGLRRRNRRRVQRRPGAARGSSVRLGRPLARRQLPRLDPAFHPERDLPVPLPLEHRPDVLRRGRSARAGRAPQRRRGAVYQLEPDGEGSCTSPTGCIALMSSGAAAEQHESAFLDASESGNDVFFMGAGTLAPQDKDTVFDIYDASVCTPSLPCPPAPLPEHKSLRRRILPGLADDAAGSGRRPGERLLERRQRTW